MGGAHAERGKVHLLLPVRGIARRVGHACATISTRGPSSGGSRRCFAAPAMTCCARRSRGRSRASGTWMAPGGRCGRASARPAERCSPWRGSWSATAATEARSATATRTATLVPRTAASGDRTMPLLHRRWQRGCEASQDSHEGDARQGPAHPVRRPFFFDLRETLRETHPRSPCLFSLARLRGRCARRAQSGGLVSVTPLTRSRLKSEQMPEE